MQRKQHWEDVYRKRQPNEVSWFQAQPDTSLDMIRRCGLAENQALIDVGGGASHLVDKLLEASYRDISVLDISSGALDHAKARLGASAGKVVWLESDVTIFEPPKQYALWHDRAVFHFLTEADDRRKYLDVLGQALVPGGHVIIATFAPDGPEKCSNLPVERYDEGKLKATVGAGLELMETRSEAHRTPKDITQHFMFFRLRKTP